MKVLLRPHHLLCLQGYKGHNYNSIQKHNWKTIINLLESNPKTDIFFVTGKDDLCANCSAKIGLSKSKCKEQDVAELDNKIKNLIGVKEGKKYFYSSLLKKLRKVMTPQKHEELCKNCAWWKKGLCRDSFKKIFKDNKKSIK